MDLPRYLAVLRRRWIALVVCLVAGVCGGLYSGHSGVKVYAATSRAIVNVPTAQALSEALAGAQLSGSLISTYANLATSRAVATRVVDQLHLPESIPQLQSKVTASVVPNTFIISITVSDPDPQRAASLADEVAVALRDQVAAVQSGRSDAVNVQPLDQAVVPGAPRSPRPTLDLVVGTLLGLLGGLLLIAAMEALDRSVRTTAQTDALVRAPLLAVVPQRRDRSRTLVAADEREPAGEPYRALRTALRFLDPDSPIRTLVVSSPAPDEGKTTLVANLALALASSGMRVIAVDADLRRGRLGEMFGLESAVGLTSVVTHQADLRSALQQWRANLQVLPSGPLPPNPSEILGSETVAGILGDLAGMADMVLIDATPVLPVTDAVVLGTQVDGMLLVVRHGKTDRHALAATRRSLDTVGVHVLGYVYNGIPAPLAGDYYYEYLRREPRGGGRRRRELSRAEEPSLPSHSG